MSGSNQKKVELDNRNLLPEVLTEKLLEAFEMIQKTQKETSEQILDQYSEFDFKRILDEATTTYLDSYNDLFDSVAINPSLITMNHIYSDIAKHMNESFAIAGAALRNAMHNEKRKQVV